MIPREIKEQFPEKVRMRGESYRAEGRVSLMNVSENLVTAEVRGSALYRVSVRRTRKGELRFSCTCPFGAVDGLCKHVWATLLEAGAVVGLPGEGRDKIAAPWQTQVKTLAELMSHEPASVPEQAATWSASRRLAYVLDVHATSLQPSGLVVEIAMQKRDEQGDWAEPRPSRLSHDTWLTAPELVDREIAQMLVGTQSEHGYYSPGASSRRYVVSPNAFDTILRRMVESGRAFLRVLQESRVHPLTWDDGAPWVFRLKLDRLHDKEEPWYELRGCFVRGDQELGVNDPSVVIRGGLLIVADTVHRFVDDLVFPAIASLRTSMQVRVGADEALELIHELYRLPRIPLIELPEDFGIVEAHGVPRNVLELKFLPRQQSGAARAQAVLSFQYGDVRVGALQREGHQTHVFDKESRRVLHRDIVAEMQAQIQLLAMGFKLDQGEPPNQPVYVISAGKAERAGLELSRAGWEVLMDDQRLRDLSSFALKLEDGIDWFELQGRIEFGDAHAGMPELLAAVKSGSRRLKLSDGSAGVLPEELYDRLAVLATAGSATSDRLRYSRPQAALLGSLLETIPAVELSEEFERIRLELSRFDGIRPAEPPAGFVGQLRDYQKEGLGWLHFLRRFGFGGVLADDMGLGKTVQALALLEQRRAEGAGTSLVVVPNSLVFNWEQEAARFAPQLRVLVHTGIKRKRGVTHYDEYDVVLTTYGTLRRDAVELARFEFDYVILDESQAIKNATTRSARAAHRLKARHRLAMTGTPIENRLAELWSVLDFLNPGVLGSAAAFGRLARESEADANGQSEEGGSSRELVARAIRPYILRRTKEQVAKDLPEKLEQTLFVDLDKDERRRYNELRDHFRQQLLGNLAARDFSKAKVHVLEALLRLRQAACHPGLIDLSRAGEGSSKLEVLRNSVREVVDEGHKVLVFSQFTSLLAIVRRALDESQIVYEYLDGQTKDRGARVERFQTDPDCPVFLISLKAGGLGLNLTAADYVFLLDPWWNPAVESQAIDRTHRIGQTRRVFATRLIARDTVEEKVLLLQDRKRDLADAIIRADGGPLSDLTREELEQLLS